MMAQAGTDHYIKAAARHRQISPIGAFPSQARSPYISRVSGTGRLYDATLRTQMNLSQLTLFEHLDSLPEGFQYQPEFLTKDEERGLIDRFQHLPFKEFEFHGFLGKRRVVSFGWKYDFSARRLRESEPIPEFILPIREKAAAFAAIDPQAIAHVLVTEYSPGTAIGWHKDRPHFEDVIGISLASECVFRLRRKSGSSWQRGSITLAPRSVYVMRGPVRNEWEHSISALTSLRYSITFRNLRVR
jgi:alkylated DNA repair dioxygenase AlkB